MESPLLRIYGEMIDGDRAAVEAGVRTAMQAGQPVASILNDALIAATQGKRRSY